MKKNEKHLTFFSHDTRFFSFFSHLLQKLSTGAAHGRGARVRAVGQKGVPVPAPYVVVLRTPWLWKG